MYLSYFSSTITPNRFVAQKKCRWCESLCDSVRDRISLERTQTGWQRAGGEARLSLAASSSLAAHRDFFFLSPRHVWLLSGCDVFSNENSARGKTALPSRLDHVQNDLPGAHQCHLCNMQVGE